MALKLVVVHADVQFFEQHVVQAYCGGWAVKVSGNGSTDRIMFVVGTWKHVQYVR